jgi:hypothetical protein
MLGILIASQEPCGRVSIYSTVRHSKGQSDISPVLEVDDILTPVVDTSVFGLKRKLPPIAIISWRDIHRSSPSL